MADKEVRSDLPIYNILLLGESGVGKSMFVNSFVNYVQFETLDAARKSQLKMLIPVQFEMTDDNGKSINVSAGGTSDNECLESGQSGTKWCKSYVIRFGKLAVRLLDAPGVGSTVNDDGHKMDTHEDCVKQDQAIVEDILHFITSFDHLHAIAIVLKANETRYTDRFNYCLKRLMKNLNKTAFNNMVFIVNFASDSNYAVPSSLQKRLQEIILNPNISKERMFTFDQRWVRHLLAENNGAIFEECEKLIAAKAWSKSQASCARLLSLITGNENAPGLEPYKVADTLSIHDARLFIRFVRPIVETILTVVEKNEKLLNSYLEIYAKAKGEANVLHVRHLLYNIEIKLITLEKPLTICISEKCTRLYDAEDGTVMKHRTNLCCDGCLVTGSAWRRRLFCQVFNLWSGTCKKCGCHVNDHQRVYYKTEEVNHEDENVADFLSANDKEEAIKKIILFIEKQQMKLRGEKRLIESADAKFKDFLKTNPIFPDKLGARETDEVILPDEVYAIKAQLFGLELHGKQIRQAYDIAKKGVENDENVVEETVIFLKDFVQNFFNLADNFKNKVITSLKSK